MKRLRGDVLEILAGEPFQYERRRLDAQQFIGMAHSATPLPEFGYLNDRVLGPATFDDDWGARFLARGHLQVAAFTVWLAERMILLDRRAGLTLLDGDWMTVKIERQTYDLWCAGLFARYEQPSLNLTIERLVQG